MGIQLHRTARIWLGHNQLAYHPAYETLKLFSLRHFRAYTLPSPPRSVYVYTHKGIQNIFLLIFFANIYPIGTLYFFASIIEKHFYIFLYFLARISQYRYILHDNHSIFFFFFTGFTNIFPVFKFVFFFQLGFLSYMFLPLLRKNAVIFY